MTLPTTPKRLDLKKDAQLTIEWADGHVCVYPIAYLRDHCPCASCREERRTHEKESPKPRTSLKVLKDADTSPLSALGAHLVGNYAMQIEWSDKHTTGIYTFEYLRQICPEKRCGCKG
jgi:DUF971 family protein